MERMSCHTSTAKATVSGRAFCPTSTAPFSKRASVLSSRVADLSSSVPLEPVLGAKLVQKGNKVCLSRKSRRERVQATIAEPPLEVASETFPRGGQWQVTLLFSSSRALTQKYNCCMCIISYMLDPVSSTLCACVRGVAKFTMVA